MNKEEFFKEYATTYKNYLEGTVPFEEVYNLENKINSTVIEEASSVEEIKGIVRSNLAKIKEIENEVKEKYDKEIGEPLVQELLDLLQFSGLVKSTEYKKKALELKEKLEKYDSLLEIRERALHKFFGTKRGSRYNEFEKIRIALKVGALFTRNL